MKTDRQRAASFTERALRALNADQDGTEHLTYALILETQADRSAVAQKLRMALLDYQHEARKQS